MFRELYYRLFYFPDVRNANGLMRFGERCINAMLGRAKRMSASARKSTLRLEIERESLEEYLKSVQRNHLLDDDEFFGISKKVRTGTFFVVGIFITECLLAYYSTLVLISGTDLDISLLRWLLAMALTLGAITTSEKLLEACLPQRYPKKESTPPKSIPVIILWSLLLVLVLLGVVAVAEARVRDIEGNQTGTIVYYGFIALSTVLPLIAGTIAWEIARYYDSYKQTRRYRTAIRRLDQLMSRVGQNMQREKESYEVMLTVYWSRYNNFRSFKENYDQKHGSNGSAMEATSYDYEEFKRVSEVRYGAVRQDRARVVDSILPSRLLFMTPDVAATPSTEGNGNGEAVPDGAVTDKQAEPVVKPGVPPYSPSFLTTGFRVPRQPVKRTVRVQPKRRRKNQ